MKESYWGYWLIVLGAFVVIIMLLIQNVASNNTFDESAIRRITEAAMVDAVDYGYYRMYGELKINKEKFIESFWRRFAEEANIRTEYDILITGMYEAPPKVSVEVNSKTGKLIIGTSSEDFDMTTRVSDILENNS